LIYFVLLATVKRDMQLTRLAIGATCRDKKPSVRRHAMLSRMIDELALVEIDKCAAEQAGVLGIEVAVNPLQQLPGSIVAAIGDVRIAEDPAGMGLMPPFVIALNGLFVVELAIVCGYAAWLIL
jgi:hypothetical protein